MQLLTELNTIKRTYVKKAAFKTTKDSIIIRVTEKNKGASDLVFQLDEEQEKKNAKTKEKDA